MIENLDKEIYVYWFRRLPAHPSHEFGKLAASFRDVVAKHLGLARPYPEIVWFRPEDPRIAEQEFLEAMRKQRGLGWRTEDNPFILPCECFRFPQETGEREIFWGYTPREQQRLIGIATECPRGSVLWTIAHECVHVLQDQLRPGWRAEHREDAEAEACWRADEIRHAFPEWFEAEKLSITCPGDSEP